MVKAMAGTLLGLVAVFALTVAGEDVGYKLLVQENAVVPLGLKFSHTSEDVPEPTAYKQPCELEDDACQDPVFSHADKAVLTVAFKVPKKLPALKAVGEKVLEEPTKIQFKACYAKPWTVNRKWRKAKDVISKDKRCKKEMAVVDITESEAVFTFPADTPKAQWFVTAYVKCPVKDSDDLEVCAVDTTGGIGALVADATAETSDVIYYQTNVVDSRTTALYVAVVVLSITSVSLLVGFFIFEQVTKKNK